MHDVIWAKMQISLEEGLTPELHDLFVDLSTPTKGFWSYGDKAFSKAKDLIRKYYIARIGINHVLHVMTESGIEMSGSELTTVNGLVSLLQKLSQNRMYLLSYNIVHKNHELLDKEPRQLACAKGIPSNMIEFVKYALGQRQTSEVELKGYDQGYFLRKKGSYSAAPWIVSLGPVSAMALTYCCAVESKFPRNIADFCSHLASYGIYIHPSDFSKSELGSVMTNLGLVLDSPDAEGGMMVYSPFNKGEFTSG